MLHASIDEIEDRYVEGAQRTYPGTMDGQVEEWVLWPSRSVWATLTLECDDPEVLGPLPGALPLLATSLAGLGYRARRRRDRPRSLA